MNENNVGFIKEVTHIHNDLRFWIEMWRLSLL
jgi:hypothetical protein